MSGYDCKSETALQTMDHANRVVRKILDEMARRATPGVSTADLDAYAESRLAEEGVQPAFKGYRGFPAVLCTSVNDEVVHGIPSRKKRLREGDLLSLDFGAVADGFYADAAVTITVGKGSDEARRLIEITRESLLRGIEQVRAGNRIQDISRAVQTHVESAGFSVVREFVGHGIGRSLHEDPQVPNFVSGGPNPKLHPGLVLAIEPMVSAGRPEVQVDPNDRWTARTQDGSLSAHWELSVAVTENGPWVLGEPEPMRAVS